MVTELAALPNVTVPGPLNLLQVCVRVPPDGSASSLLTVPARLAVAGRVIVWSAPALTVGGLVGDRPG